MVREAAQCRCCGGYSAIFMDCCMPVMDGFEATKQLKLKMQAGELRPAPIIGLTAYDNESDLQMCRDAGMDGVLAKPVSFKVLDTKLKEFRIIA